MTDTPRTVIEFPKRPPVLRLIDCQGERTMSALKGSVLAINPTGMDLEEIVQKERIRQRAKRAADARNKIAEGFCELIEEVPLTEAHAWLHRLLDGDKGRRHD